jgi:hypothetical protein
MLRITRARLKPPMNWLRTSEPSSDPRYRNRVPAGQAHPIDEVKSLGFITSKTRTQEQTLIGTLWNGNIQDFWNEIAPTAALGHHLGLARSGVRPSAIAKRNGCRRAVCTNERCRVRMYRLRNLYASAPSS